MHVGKWIPHTEREGNRGMMVSTTWEGSQGAAQHPSFCLSRTNGHIAVSNRHFFSNNAPLSTPHPPSAISSEGCGQPGSGAVGAQGSAASTGGKSRSPSGADSIGGRGSLARACAEAAQTRILRGEVYGKVETETGTRTRHQPLYLK